MLRKTERDVLEKYAKFVGMPYEVNERLYLKGSPEQRKRDIIAQKAALFINEQKNLGKIKLSKTGKVRNIKETDKLLSEWLKKQEKVPDFFYHKLDKKKVSN